MAWSPGRMTVLPSGSRHLPPRITELPQGLADAGGVLAHAKLQRLDLAVGQAVKGLHAAAGGIAHGAHVAGELLGDEVLGRNDAVQPRALEELREVLAVDLHDDLAHGALAGVHGGDDVVAVFAGQRHEGVGGAEAVLLQHVAARRVAADDMGVLQQVAEPVAALPVLLDHRDRHAALLQHPGQVDRRAAAADDHHLPDGLPELPDGGEEAAQLLHGAGDVQPVPGAQGENAVGDQGVPAALHHAHEHLDAERRAEILELQAVEHAALGDAVLHDLHAALGKGVHPDGAGEAQDARDLFRALVIRVHDQVQPQRFAQEGFLAEIFRVADAGDHVFGAEMPRRDAANHVHLVGLRGGQQQIRLRRARFPQGVGVGGAALHTDHVKRVGKLRDQLGVVVDDGDVVPLVGKDGGDRMPDLSAARDDDLHGSSLRSQKMECRFRSVLLQGSSQGEKAEIRSLSPPNDRLGGKGFPGFLCTGLPAVNIRRNAGCRFAIRKSLYHTRRRLYSCEIGEIRL